MYIPSIDCDQIMAIVIWFPCIDGNKLKKCDVSEARIWWANTFLHLCILKDTCNLPGPKSTSRFFWSLIYIAPHVLGVLATLWLPGLSRKSC